MEKRENFLGTYFSKDTVLRLTSVAKLLSWVVVGVYALEWLVQALAMVLQITRGFWTGMGFTDVAQSILYLFEQPLRGVVYFVVLQGVAQALLMFMDIEDNTRRAGRGMKE
ncbi:MAG: hypothetical protein IMZ73_01645 [Chloroflexi bacterium]|nr:hypothetical protein [Chloroflexota bacterium]